MRLFWHFVYFCRAHFVPCIIFTFTNSFFHSAGCLLPGEAPICFFYFLACVPFLFMYTVHSCHIVLIADFYVSRSDDSL